MSKTADIARRLASDFVELANELEKEQGEIMSKLDWIEEGMQ